MSGRRASVFFACCGGLIALAMSAIAAAHESRPIYIELTETQPQRFQLQWKIPASVPVFNLPSVTLPKICQLSGRFTEFEGSGGLIRRGSYRCSQGLAGEVVQIRYPGPNPSVSSLLRYRTLSGEQHLAVLAPDEVTWTVPQSESRSAVAQEYAQLGIEHIWTGFDHLLFLVCLLWIAGSWRRILITITGFTLAHSATLILAALQIVRLPVPPVEAAIALSIVFLATEIVKGPRESLTWRHPIAVSSSFGLLHGLGFAAALSEIGLPQIELATGLLFFNLGVEIGQVLFAAAVIGVMRASRRIALGTVATMQAAVPATRIVTAYAVGSLAMFWLIQRTSEILSGAR